MSTVGLQTRPNLRQMATNEGIPKWSNNLNLLLQSWQKRAISRSGRFFVQRIITSIENRSRKRAVSRALKRSPQAGPAQTNEERTKTLHNSSLQTPFFASRFREAVRLGAASRHFFCCSRKWLPTYGHTSFRTRINWIFYLQTFFLSHCLHVIVLSSPCSH